MANMSIAQENKKNKLYEKFLNSSRIDSLLAREILDGTNSYAKDILRVCGFKNGRFDKTYHGMAPLSAVADFYGVKEKHLTGVIRKCGFTHRDFAEDYRGFREWDEEADRRTVKDFVSPRMALAASALMYYGKIVPKDGKACKVFKRLMNTGYYIKAREKQEALNKVEKTTETENIAETVEENVNIVQSDAVVSMSVDRFVEMVVLAAQKLNEHGKSEVQKPEKSKRASQKNKDASPKRVSKRVPLPENWADIVDKRQRGEISAKEAIAISGLPCSSFYYHYSQAINN